MHKKRLLYILILLSFFLLISQASANDNSTFEDLSDEINNTFESQTLDLKTDYVNSAGSTYINITKPITIEGNGHIIDANNKSRIFYITSDNVCIKNTTFISANSQNLAGGSISWWGNNASLVDCKFINSKAVSGGGAVYFNGNNITLTNCEFNGNHVTYGADISLTGKTGFDPSKLHIQTVNSHGGAVYFDGDNIDITDCRFSNNTADLDGGALTFSWSSNINISNSLFKGNSVKYNGGAIDVNGENFTMTNSIFENNDGESSKDLFLNSRNNRIINSTFETNDTVESWYDVTLIGVKYGKIGTFDELAQKINQTTDLLVLDKDYYYLKGTNKGVLISKPITIDGQGHKLDGRKLSRIFNITSDNVTIKNINFINGNAFGRYFTKYVGGGAIYWSGANGLIENCSFTNNTGSGIEDDPFEKAEETYEINGTVYHTIRVRPMGTKINEGGAMVWNGTNGTVSNCIFINNHVGYPNTGGAVCWRGDDGKIFNSQFYQNSAWAGSAIAWIGNNGTISYAIIKDNGFFDGGIYWFGANGTVKNSILLGNNRMSVLRSSYKINADYNFWGDTVQNPNQTNKNIKLNNWLVMNFSHNGEFVEEGTKLRISYDITSLYENGTFTGYYDLINCSGEVKFTANRTGFLNIGFEDGKITFSIDSGDYIVSKNLKTYYSKTINYKVTVYDISGKVSNRTVKFAINDKEYKVKTDSNGVAILKLKLKPGKYKVTSSYSGVKVKNKIIIKSSLKTRNKSVSAKKSGKFTVKVLNSKGKAYAKQLVKIKFKGKTYKLKTNKKGIATFKIPKNLKVGKYKIKGSVKNLTDKITLIHCI